MQTKALFLGASAAAALYWRRRSRFSLAGRRALVSGGSRGLGLSIARALAAQGVNLGLLARDEDELREAREHIQLSAPCRVDTFPCDLRDVGQLDATIARVLERWERIDILVNDAGVIQVGPLEHMSMADFEQAMAVHFWAPLRLMRAVVPVMRRQKEGRIVNISSVGGKVAIPHLTPYCASKFALTGLSDGMRAELARDSIYVTTVTPGLMRTGSHVNALMKGKHAEEFAWFSIGAATPGFSMDADRAARRIVRACQRGARSLELTLPAKLLIRANALAPSALGALMEVSSQLMPRPTDQTGDVSRLGRESQSPLSPSFLTQLADREVNAHNEHRAALR